MSRLTDGTGGGDAMDALRMSSITYRIATGPHAGRKVATLQTLPTDADALEGDACPEPTMNELDWHHAQWKAFGG